MKPLSMKHLLASLLAAGALAASAVNPTVVPMPQTYEATDGAFKAPRGGVSTVYMAPEADLDSALTLAWLADAGLRPAFTPKQKKAQVSLRLDSSVSSPEGYTIAIEPRSIDIAASDRRGLIYALQTLRQLGAGGELACASIADEPAYAWRSFLLDESRHFFGTEVVESIIDEMSRLKLNTLHWHLTDGAGWRLEVPAYPRLTEVGSKLDYTHRFVTPEQWDSIYPGWRAYYTAPEVRHIIDYARDRGIKVMPEIDVPGHSLAAIKAYPQLGSSTPAAGAPVTGDLLNVTKPEVDEFLTTVFNYVVDLFEPEYVHIGGDECEYKHWTGNDTIRAFMDAHGMKEPWELQDYAVRRVAHTLADRGVKAIGWNEITGHGNRAPEVDGMVAQFWEGDISRVGKAAAQGYQVVNSAQLYTYFDYPYEKGTPLWKVYRLDPRPADLDPALAAKVIGCGAQMWAEKVPDYRQLCHMTFPRLGAFAECGWTKPERKDYNDFIRRMAPIQQDWRARGILNGQPEYSLDEPNAIAPPGR
ncbi:MAG: beta-N-acetylhexosaminidase [Muribaculaceae bacterium]|nr:beta-N-acetylhexosaminidase [Muribaculaceae bacterium]